MMNVVGAWAHPFLLVPMFLFQVIRLRIKAKSPKERLSSKWLVRDIHITTGWLKRPKVKRKQLH